MALQSIKTRPMEEIRLYSRRLSQEFPTVDTSLDVYYREKAVGVPFLWESQPGTPKIRIRDFPLPPLTPPPSFHASSISRKPIRKQPRNILPKLSFRKAQFEQSPSPSSSSSPSSPLRVSSLPRLSYDSRIEEDDCESPVSSLCFRGGRGRSRGCSSSIVRLLLGES